MIDSHRTFLHVDDDPQVTRLVAAKLEKYGYHASPLHDSQQAMDVIVRSQHRVVLLDIDMPGLNGLDLLRDIKSFDGGVQALMLTGLVDMSTVLQSMRFGADACFFKPLHDIQALVTALDATFAKIDRWWETLEDLSRRRRRESSTPRLAPAVR